VPVYDQDTPELLHARIQEAEHILYPAAVAALASGQVRIEGRRCFGAWQEDPAAVG
jgi:phosphoribosylglycinamide formyltransferase-1